MYRKREGSLKVIFSENRFQERELYLQSPELRHETADYYLATLHSVALVICRYGYGNKIIRGSPR